MKAVKSYTLNWTKLVCYPNHLKFKGHRLRVKKAPEPSTIMWENLETTQVDRNARKSITSIVAFLAIFLSVLFTFHARSVQEDAMESGGTKECPNTWDDLTEQDKLEWAIR